MKHLIFCILCFAGVTMFMGSCNSKQTKEVFNDSIQGTFFGVSFGADKKELVNKFAERKLVPNPYISTEDFLSFQPIGGRRFSFGGLSWESLNVGMSNGKFFAISFYNTLKDKAEAIREGKLLIESISAKYKMIKEEPKDSFTYIIYRGKSIKESGRDVVVHVCRYEGADKKIYYGTFLQYLDRKYEGTVSDEL